MLLDVMQAIMAIDLAAIKRTALDRVAIGVLQGLRHVVATFFGQPTR